LADRRRGLSRKLGLAEEIRHSQNSLRDPRTGTRKITAGIHGKYVAVPYCSQRIPLGWKWYFRELSLNFVHMIATGHREDKVGITVDYGLPADLIPGLTGAAQNVNSTREGYHLRHPVPTHKRWVEPLEAQDAQKISRAFCSRPGKLCSNTRHQFACLRRSTSGLADKEDVVPNVCDSSWAEGNYLRLRG
jgi:hypothetical protein